MADFVKQKRDLGCKAHTVTSIDEKRSLMGSGKTFFGLIGGLGDYMSKSFYDNIHLQISVKVEVSGI